jgi:hypothetical protein
MFSFFLGIFQILVIIETISLAFLYFVSKWMLLRVSKKPTGLTKRMSNLA